MAKLQDTSRDKLESRNEPGFLSRWSRRKQGQQESVPDVTEKAVGDAFDESIMQPTDVLADSGIAGHEAVPVEARLSAETDAADLLQSAPDEAATTSVEAISVVEDPLTEQEVLLSDEDMPPLETLQEDSDVSMFLNRGVSRELRKAALRKLFSLPGLNITDGLNDYDEDYTTFEPLGDIVTSDMRFHAERKARLAEEAEAEKRAALQAEAGDDNAGDAEDDDSTSVEHEESVENDESVEEEICGEASAGDSHAGEEPEPSDSAETATVQGDRSQANSSQQENPGPLTNRDQFMSNTARPIDNNNSAHDYPEADQPVLEQPDSPRN